MTLFNPIVSGVSVSGDLDTQSTTLKIEMGNSDKIGHVNFVLQNSAAQYSKMLMSGNSTFEIDSVTNNIGTVLMKGTVEKLVPEVDLKSSRGSIVTVDGYDHAQELMEVISPDARPPYLVYTPTSGAQSGVTQFYVTSGDGGLQSTDGIDLVLYTSGVNVSVASNLVSVTVAQFMSQWFGTSGDHTGSSSGVLFSYKPYTPTGSSGSYPWTTYYTPDSSGGVAANDNNNNYYLYQDKLKAKREYAWDTLRKITRQQVAVDGNGNPAPYEMYVDTVGAIHLYTSGSYQLVASGAGGQVFLQYYPANTSGCQLNNIITATVPFDLTQVKNVIEGWFQDWTQYPYDGELWTSFTFLSGGYVNAPYKPYLSGGVWASVNISGGPPATNVGGIAIYATGYSGNILTNSISLEMTVSIFSGGTVNVNQWNVDTSGGVGQAVDLNFNLYTTASGGGISDQQVQIALVDLSGNSSTAPPVDIGTISGWGAVTVGIFGSGGVLEINSGVNFNAVAQINITNKFMFSSYTNQHVVCTMGLDNLMFSFDYPFSPVTAFSSGSQGMYGRRYGTLEWPYEVSAGAASGIVVAELENSLASQSIASFTVKDNPGLPFSAQLGIKVGQVFVVDSPYFNTGSGQFFYYWRATAIEHDWDKNNNGFETIIKAVPWYSGAIVSPNSVNVNATTPILYSQTPIPPPAPLSYRMQYQYYKTAGL